MKKKTFLFFAAFCVAVMSEAQLIVKSNGGVHISNILEEGKTWVVDNDVASGNIFHILAEFSISEGPIASDVQFWSVSQLQYMNGGVIKEAEVVRDYYEGEKDGRLYFWDGSEQHEPDLFMDFSLTVGSP